MVFYIVLPQQDQSEDWYDSRVKEKIPVVTYSKEPDIKIRKSKKQNKSCHN